MISVKQARENLRKAEDALTIALREERLSRGNKLRLARKVECDHDFQPKFNSHNDSFAFFRCDKCGAMR